MEHLGDYGEPVFDLDDHSLRCLCKLDGTITLEKGEISVSQMTAPPVSATLPLNTACGRLRARCARQNDGTVGRVSIWGL